MDDAVVAREHPEIAHAVRQHVITERQDGVVLHLADIVEIHTRQTLDAASPYRMAHGVLH